MTSHITIEIESSVPYRCVDCQMANVPLRFLPQGEAICERCAGPEWYDVFYDSDEETEQWGAA